MSETEEEPWYAKGLPFECTGCGDCCRGPGGHVWLTPEEAEGLAMALDLSNEDFDERYLRRVGERLALVDGAHGDCVLLDPSGACSVYEARPMQCRTYPWWPEVVSTRRLWQQEAKFCEGIGRDVIVPLSTIKEQLALVKKSAKL